MKSSTKRIMMSVLTLVMTVVALGTTTFAWFSLSNVANVGNISGSVQGGEGLEVRLSSGTYEGDFKNNLGANEWLEFQTAVLSGFEFGAVTTSDAEEFEYLKQTDTGSLKFEDLSIADGMNKKYLEFNIDFRSYSGTKVNLTGLDFLDSESLLWKNTGGSSYNQLGKTPITLTNDDVMSSAANAARVAFIHGSTTEVFQEATNTNTAEGYNANGYKLNGTTIEGNNLSGTTPVSFGQWSYLKDSKGVVIENATGVITDPSTLTNILVEAHSVDDVAKKVSIDLTPGATDEDYNTGSVTVRIWIEGWDADAYDAIYKRLLVVNFVFTKE